MERDEQSEYPTPETERPSAFTLDDVVVLPDGRAFVPVLVTGESSVGHWARLLRVLASGVRVRLSSDAARFLLESRPVRSQSRAGFVLDLDGRLVRLWRDDDGWLAFSGRDRGISSGVRASGGVLWCGLVSEGVLRFRDGSETSQGSAVRSAE